jgi:hypothetical protein
VRRAERGALGTAALVALAGFAGLALAQSDGGGAACDDSAFGYDGCIVEITVWTRHAELGTAIASSPGFVPVGPLVDPGGGSGGGTGTGGSGSPGGSSSSGSSSGSSGSSGSSSGGSGSGSSSGSSGSSGGSSSGGSGSSSGGHGGCHW